MSFETERTILRPFKPGDSELLFNLYNDPEIQSLAFTDYVAAKLEKWIKENHRHEETRLLFKYRLEERVVGEGHRHRDHAVAGKLRVQEASRPSRYA